MGLDMYLVKYPRFRGATPRDIEHIESYLEWASDDEKRKKYSLKEWCGVDFEELPDIDMVSFYSKVFNEKSKNEYGYKTIHDQIGYWRKANHIHNWFVENCQDGEDDCDYHNEVTRWQLIELRDLCQDVIDHSKLIHGNVGDGEEYTNGKWVKNYRDGLVIDDPSYAAEHMPTVSGFFFGSEGYDEYYIDDLKRTIEICDKAIATTDFDCQMIYYVSSW